MDGSDLDLDSGLRLVVAMVNFTGEIIAITERADAITILLWFVAAVALS